MFRLLGIGIILLLLIVWDCPLTVAARTDHFSPGIRPLQMSHFGDRILIVVPHPDDETLATGGLIQKAIQSHKQVRVIAVTNGDGFRKAAAVLSGNSEPQAIDYQKLGFRRQTELLKAITTLGLAPDQVQFIGFPDGGLHLLWSEHWQPDRPYIGRTGFPNYTGSDLASLLAAAIHRYQPTDIIYPSGLDRHEDHIAAHAFIRQAIAQNQIRVQEWLYLIHVADWPMPRGFLPNFPLQIPAVLDNQSAWHSLKLTPAEIQIKYRALQQHQTQIRVMRRFLESFVRKNELFQHPV